MTITTSPAPSAAELSEHLRVLRAEYNELVHRQSETPDLQTAAELSAHINSLATEIDQTITNITTLITTTDPDTNIEAVPAPTRYVDVFDWFGEWFSQVVEQPATITDLRWCTEWDQHSGAVTRLTALWHAWEHARMGEPDAMAHWWVSLADPIMHTLRSERGPFGLCTTSEHRATTPLGGHR